MVTFLLFISKSIPIASGTSVMMVVKVKNAKNRKTFANGRIDVLPLWSQIKQCLLHI